MPHGVDGVPARGDPAVYRSHQEEKGEGRRREKERGLLRRREEGKPSRS